MNKKIKICSYLVTICSIFGVYQLLGKKSYEKNNIVTSGVVNEGDETMENIGDMTVPKVKETITKDYTFNDVASLKKVSTELKIGDINILPSDSNDIKVNAEYCIGADNKKDLELIKNKIDVAKANNANDCTLRVVNNEEGTDMWVWAYNNLKNFSLSVKLTIYIPNNISVYSAENKIGHISLSNIKGNIQVNTGNGSISLNGCTFINDSSVVTKLGNIDLTLGDAEESAILNCSTKNGNISCIIGKELKNSIRATLSTKVGDVNINLNDQSISYNTKKVKEIDSLINGVCSLKASTKNGSIKVS